VCPPSVLKYVISNLKFSPIPPYQDECHAVFLCGVNYVAEEFRLCVKRVNVSEKQILKKEIFKDEIGQNGIGKGNCKQQKCIACYARYKWKKKFFLKWRRQIKFVFLKSRFSLLECQLLASATFLTPACCLPHILTYLFLLHVNLT